MITIYVSGIGLLGPGLTSWVEGREILLGNTPYQAQATQLRTAEMLPPAERRRAGVPIKLAMATGQEAFMHAPETMSSAATVFTSSGGDNDNVHVINTTLATAPKEISPTRFHNSVHNAAAGYWCIAAATHKPSTSLCAHDASFAAGLLEAATQLKQGQSLLALFAYDHYYPEPLHTVRPLAGALSTTLVLSAQPDTHTFASLDIEFSAGAMDTELKDTALEALRLGIPAARALPLLTALAKQEASNLTLAYFSNNHLNIKVMPC